MPGPPLRILHVIHDFLPRHQAGSEIYAAALCRALAAGHHVTVLAAEYDPARAHGSITWRLHDGVAVAEVVNNWAFPTFADTWRAPSLRDPIDHVLRATAPDVVHLHNLLNLSFELPALARARGAAVVATLHDYTLLCPSGGQLVHRSERHVCDEIDADRCVRCFRESPFAAQMAAARWPPGAAANRRTLPVLRRLRAIAPAAASTIAARAMQALPAASMDASAIATRLEAARRVFADLDLIVAPSAALARQYERSGCRIDRVLVRDYGFEPLGGVSTGPSTERLRIGFAGTLTWHKGVHVLLEAVRSLPRDRYEVRIAGDPAVFPDYTAALRDAARGLPVTFTGRFERGDTPGIYAGIDVLAVPSLWPENSPLVIHEAFMAGVPVVAARMGGIPELVTDGVSGLLFDPHDPSTLTAAFARLLDEPELLQRLRANRPAVGSLADDAGWWSERYRELAAAGRRRRA